MVGAKVFMSLVLLLVVSFSIDNTLTHHHYYLMSSLSSNHNNNNSSSSFHNSSSRLSEPDHKPNGQLHDTHMAEVMTIEDHCIGNANNDDSMMIGLWAIAVSENTLLREEAIVSVASLLKTRQGILSGLLYRQVHCECISC